MEESLLKWLEVGDSIQKIDVYNKKFRTAWFKIFYNISKSMYFSEYLYQILILIFFGQIFGLNITKTNTENDKLLEIIEYLNEVLLFQKSINSDKAHNTVLIIAFSFFALSLILEIISTILIITNTISKLFLKIYSFITLIYLYYLNGPLIQIFIYPMAVTKDKISNNNFIVLAVYIFGSIFTLIMVLNIILLSFYIDDINSLNKHNYKSKINNRYTTIIIVIKMIYFVLDLLLSYILKDTTFNIYVYQIIFVLFNLFLAIYTCKNVYFYNNTIDILNRYSWYFATWFSICILFKKISKTNDITLFLIIGLILIGIATYFSRNYRTFKLLTEFNILAGNKLQDLEIYSNLLFKLSNQKDPKSKTLLAGIIKKAEEGLKSNPELNEVFNKFISKAIHFNLNLYSSISELKVLCLIGTSYISCEEKSNYKIDITLNKCYFLINKCKNLALAVYIATKINANTHMHAYYKYVLLEDIKEHLLNKLTKNRKKLSMKNIQLSSVILYSQLLDLFKIEIYDAACSQIEYFDILKNNISTEKATENFLKTGENILSLRNNILTIWEKMIELNPTDLEAEKDYLIYLDVILQDEFLKKEEMKKHKEKKNEYLTNKNNLYFEMYNQEKSAILLCDGYSFNGKIFYYTPNFASLFGFTGKEISNITIDDLLPDVVQSFHKYLVEENTKYTNILTIYKNKRNMLLKGKNGLLFNIYLYLRIVPNLQYGLLYMLYIQKIHEKNFMIVLDDKMHIDGFTENGQISSVNAVSNFGLSQLIIGYHIGLIIPDIIFQIDYDINNEAFFFTKENIDLKGYFYSAHNTKEMNVKIKKILELIKLKKLKENEENDNYENINVSEEYNEFIKEIKSQNKWAYSIFYRIECRSFLDGKYKYYKIHITNDLLSDTLNDIISKSKNNLISNTENNKKDNNSLIDNPIKNNDKLIKLKINHNLDNIKNKKANNNNIKADNTNDNKLIENSKDVNLNQINFSQPTSNSSSILSKVNKESNEFHKLKNEIINKKDFINIKLIKYNFLIYLIIIICLIAYDYYMTKKKIKSLVKFHKENLYFTHTKIACANVYNSALNLRLIRLNIIKDEDCPNSNCTFFYSNLLIRSFTEIRELKYDLNVYYPEFQNIFNKKMITLSRRYQTADEYLNLDIDNYLNFLIANGLKIIANLTNYYSSGLFFVYYYSYDVLDNYLDNLLYSSYNFFNSDYYTGFEGKEKTKLSDKYSNNFPKRLIIALAFFLITLMFLIYLVCKIYSTECFFLEKLINFSSTNFDEYLKKLEELKKSLRDENNEDEDKNLEDIDIEEDLEDKDENKSIDKNNDIKIKMNQKKEKNKKRKNKQSKLHLQKIKKKKSMSNYFFKINTFFIVKSGISFVLLVLYFIITILLFNNYKNNFKSFDQSLVQINNIFLDIFKTFLIFKKQIEDALHNNVAEIIIPSDSDITQPKLGNALFEILHSTKYTEEYLNKIKTLYNDNACEIINKDISDDTYCQNIFSSVLSKGLDQAIVQMSIIINNCLDELTMLKTSKNLKSMYSIENNYYNYELLVGYYIFNSFLITKDAFAVFSDDEKKYITVIINVITVIYCFFLLLIISLCIYFIYLYKTEGNSFWNFIGILPNKFISDDENFYESIIKLGDLLY